MNTSLLKAVEPQMRKLILTVLDAASGTLSTSQVMMFTRSHMLAAGMNEKIVGELTTAKLTRLLESTVNVQLVPDRLKETRFGSMRNERQWTTFDHLTKLRNADQALVTARVEANARFQTIEDPTHHSIVVKDTKTGNSLLIMDTSMVTLAGARTLASSFRLNLVQMATHHNTEGK